MPLIATAGAANANTYCSLAEADAYHETHVAKAAWDAVTDDDAKGAALVMATRLLDALVQWEGVVVTSSQALLWPRLFACGRNGYPLASTTIPAEVRNACAEYARVLLGNDRTADPESAVSGLSRIKADSVELEFRAGVSSQPMPSSVFLLISHLGELRQRSGRIVRA